MPQLDKWEALKAWVRARHDYFEALYKQTNYASDAAELGALRSVYLTMKDIDEKAEAQMHAKPSNDPMRAAAGPR